MATYYVDPYAGDDSRSAAQAQVSTTPWKTLLNLTSSGLNVSLAGNDEIRVRGAEPVTVGDFTWTPDTINVTHSITGLVKEISNFLVTESWTLNNSTTSSNNTVYFHKTALSTGRVFAVPATNTGGKIATHPLSTGISIDSWKQVSVLFYLATNVANFDASKLSIRLCSDATGDVPIHTMTLQNNVSCRGQYTVFTSDVSAATGTINSISVFANSQLHTASCSIRFDNLVLTGNDTYPTLTHLDLIKNPDGHWCTIGAFHEDCFVIRGPQAAGVGLATAACYHTALVTEASELITLPANYPTVTPYTVATQISVSSKSGSAGNTIKLLGGYNSDFSAVTGYSVFSGRGTNSGIFRMNSCDYWDIDRVGFVGYNQGIQLDSCKNFTISNMLLLFHAVNGINTNTVATMCCDMLVTDSQFSYNSAAGVNPCWSYSKFVNCVFLRNDFGVNPAQYAHAIRFISCEFFNSVVNEVYFGTTTGRNMNDACLFKDCTFSLNSNALNVIRVNLPGGSRPTITFHGGVFKNTISPTTSNWLLLDTTTPTPIYLRGTNFVGFDPYTDVNITAGASSFIPSKLAFQLKDISIEGTPVSLAYNYYFPTATIQALESTPYSTDDFRWEASLQVSRLESEAIYFPIGRAYLTSGIPVTIAGHVYRSSSNINCKIVLRNAFMDGWNPEDDVESTALATTSAWTEIGVDATPTENCTVEIFYKIWGTGVSTDLVWMSPNLTVTA